MVAVFIRVDWGSFIASSCRCVISNSRWFTRARLAVSGFSQFRESSLLRTFVSPGSFVFANVHSGKHRSRRIQSGSLGFTLARLEVAAFIQFRS